MKAILNDAQIAILIAERKPLPVNYREHMRLKDKRGHKERELDLKGDNGSEFRVLLRQSQFNSLDFSAILAYQVPKSNQQLRLRRYNGKSHEHTNTIEGITFYDFHIHQATERYQLSGFKEDAYAEITDRYADFQGAIQCLLKDCNFSTPPELQISFFEEGG